MKNLSINRSRLCYSNHLGSQHANDLKTRTILWMFQACMLWVPHIILRLKLDDINPRQNILSRENIPVVGQHLIRHDKLLKFAFFHKIKQL